MDFFKNVELAPVDPILGINAAFAKDPRDKKVNLGAGVYKTEDLKPLILTAVKQAEAYILQTEPSKDYLPIDGMHEFVEETKKLVFGEIDDRIYGAQSLGGSGALRVAGGFLKEIGCSHVYISNPTWDNHRRIFTHAGLQVDTYPYYDAKSRCLDFDRFLEKMEILPARSVVVLHACCHNPTGLDLTLAEWEEVLACMKKKEIFPLFDFAYQGFGKGLDADAESVRLFLKSGIEFAVTVSHAKNFGLYAERCGELFLICKDKAQALRCGSQIKILIRGLYSSPPCHGARIVHTILTRPDLRQIWIDQLQNMCSRVSHMRKALVAELASKSGSDFFDRLSKQSGMFSYTGLDQGQVERLIEEYGIYLPKDGRINVAGLNQDNISYVAEAIATLFK